MKELQNYNDIIHQIIQIIPYFPSDDCKNKIDALKKKLKKLNGIRCILKKRFLRVEKRMAEILKMKIDTREKYQKYMIGEYNDCLEWCCIFYLLLK